MSKYTSEVRFICENMAGLVESVGYTGVDDVLKNSRGKIFDFSYPIFDEAYRPVLETKILKHFYKSIFSNDFFECLMAITVKAA